LWRESATIRDFGQSMLRRVRAGDCGHFPSLCSAREAESHPEMQDERGWSRSQTGHSQPHGGRLFLQMPDGSCSTVPHPTNNRGLAADVLRPSRSITPSPHPKHWCARHLGPLGEKPPVDVGDGDCGPTSMTAKSDIIQYAAASFAHMHKAISTAHDKHWLESSRIHSP
jgi:hypothetical protein